MTFNPWNERHWLKRVFFDKDTQRADTLDFSKLEGDIDETDYSELFNANGVNEENAEAKDH